MTESVEQAAAGVAPAGKKRRWLWALVVFGAAIAAYVGWNMFDSHVLLGPATITVSPETTYLTGPLNADGTVNYTQALIDRYSEGVTPENNAMTLLVRAFDADDFLPEETRAEILMQLGLTEGDLAGGKKFVRWRDYLEALGPDGEEIDLDGELIAQLGEEPWTAEDQPEVAAWLADNAEPLALTSQAARRPKHYYPLVSLDDPPCLLTVVPEVVMYRKATQALGARAMLHLSDGNMADARADMDTLHRLARAPNPFLIWHLVNIGIVEIAIEAEETIIMSGRLSPDDIRAMLADCKARPPLPSFTDALESEFITILDITMMLFRSDDLSKLDLAAWVVNPPDPSYVDWDVLLRKINVIYTKMIQDAKLPYPQRRVEEELADEEFRRYVLESWRRPIVKAVFHRITRNKRAARRAYTDVFSRMLLRALIPEYAKMHMLHDKTQTRSDLLLLALAAKVYKADNGDWPEQLADLAPEYLDAIPRDRFTDQPLAYVATDDGVRIYSLGPNMTDDGGMNIEDAPDDETTDCPAGADDLVIELR